MTLQVRPGCTIYLSNYVPEKGGWIHTELNIAMKSRETWSKSGFLNFEGTMKTRNYSKVFHFSL